MLGKSKKGVINQSPWVLGTGGLGILAVENVLMGEDGREVRMFPQKIFTLV